MSVILQNRYQIEQVISRGGMGTVYSAVDTRLKTEVAVKAFRPHEFAEVESPKNSVLADAFRAEAELLASLSHPSIPKALDYFEESDGQYLVMELAKGMSLEKLITKQYQNLEMSQKLNWFLQIADVIEYLHSLEQPVIHRDIKPSNIKISNKGKIFVLDFGISKEIFRRESNTNKTLQFATLEFAPLEQSIQASEQIRKSLTAINAEKTEVFLQEKTSFQTDIFSLAATLYRLLTGEMPPDAYTRALAVWSNKSDPLQKPSCLNQTIPAELDALIMQSLSISPSLRPTSVSVFKETVNKQNGKFAGILPTAEESPKIPTPKRDSSASSKITPHFGVYLRELELFKAKYLEKEQELAELREKLKSKTNLPEKHYFAASIKQSLACV